MQGLVRSVSDLADAHGFLLGFGSAKRRDFRDMEFGVPRNITDPDMEETGSIRSSKVKEVIADEDEVDTSNVLVGKTTLPQVLEFECPEGHMPGQRVCVQGPHGPLWVSVPDSKGPGDHCTYRLGPSEVFKVNVPEGALPGDKVEFDGPRNEVQSAVVPEGVSAGDTFEVTPPALMIQVPIGARPGDTVRFRKPDGTWGAAKLPTHKKYEAG
eukprot:CAMPEP_0178411232 /NCGR_PEP_ID=MMETSP0689_2-20121128/21388_1 /TAXON_ID=160604 /ORGANISM="Amphidinium massartii, Strain CS-259" /LENGTH=211 /DNA_ID=CAMNT_0020032431 /DNA_START=64 /DNA_END=696 /DNA_ORIENTATION=-